MLNSDGLINHIITFLVTTVTRGGDLRVHSDVTKAAETGAVRNILKDGCVSR